MKTRIPEPSGLPVTAAALESFARCLEPICLRKGMERRIRRSTGVSVVHEDHKPVTLPAGDYKIHRAREYDVLANLPRTIRD